MDFSWILDGVTDEVPRTRGPECLNYMTNRRRWLEMLIFSIIFLTIIGKAVKRLDNIILPPEHEINKPHTATRLLLLISMTFVFGVEMGFKFAGKSVIFVLHPCHIQTLVQIYLLAAKPTKVTTALFRIQMNNLNGPFLACLFPEVATRDQPFEQAVYWIQHALLYIIPIYILKTGAYTMEAFNDYNWVAIGVMGQLFYHFTFLTYISMYTGINLSHMLCAAVADPFQGQNYRVAAVIHESLLCPILNKLTVLMFYRHNINNRSRSGSKISTTEKMPLNKQNVNFAGINGNEQNEQQRVDFPYKKQISEHNFLLTPSDSILKQRRHSMEYIYDAPQNVADDAIESEYVTTTVMPTTKID